MHNHRTLNPSKPSKERAQRIIHAYASKAARLIANAEGRPGLRVEILVNQTRRQLNARIWADITALAFYSLAEDIAELRTMRATDWAQVWDTPADKATQLDRARQTITAEIAAHTYGYTPGAVAPNATHRIAS